MKSLILSLITLSLAYTAQAQIIKSAETEVSFFSDAPVEDIAATNKKMTAAINTDSRAIAFSVPIRGFKFEKSLMEEHFNENYLESAKFPNANFKGTISEAIDFKKDGTYKATATGTLNIHGVEQKRTLEGTITVKGGVVTLNANFKVKLADHKVEIPTIVFQNIAEIIDVKVKATLK